MSESGERHASWLELFFDLVVVVAVVQLSHRLGGDPGWGDVALFAALFYAVWSVWTSFTLYANVRASLTRIRSMLVGMFGIAVMAAAIPGVAHEVPATGETRDTWFILAYVFCRFSASQTWSRTGAIMTSWPAAQRGAGLVPWFASIWVEDPLWRYSLWGLGIALDVFFSIYQSRHPDKQIAEVDKRIDLFESRELRRAASRSRPPRPVPKFAPAVLDSAHLGERLGLFVIIVLGEAVMRVVVESSSLEVAWSQGLGLAALLGFGLVVSLWWLTLQYGLSAVPAVGSAGLKPYILLPAHFVMTAGITAMAAGLGVVAEHADGQLPTSIRWVMCGGVAAYFAASAVLGLLSGAERSWLWGWALPTAVVPLLLAAFGGPVRAWGIVAVLLMVALWRIAYEPISRRRPPAAPAPA